MSSRSVAFRVRGRVQGVGFRAFTVRAAQSLQLIGWVQNEPDGSVTGVAAGLEDALATLWQHLAKGPPSAFVEELSLEEADLPQTHRFRVRF